MRVGRVGQVGHHGKHSISCVPPLSHLPETGGTKHRNLSPIVPPAKPRWDARGTQKSLQNKACPTCPTCPTKKAAPPPQRPQPGKRRCHTRGQTRSRASRPCTRTRWPASCGPRWRPPFPTWLGPLMQQSERQTWMHSTTRPAEWLRQIRSWRAWRPGKPAGARQLRQPRPAVAPATTAAGPTPPLWSRRTPGATAGGACGPEDSTQRRGAPHD